MGRLRTLTDPVDGNMAAEAAEAEFDSLDVSKIKVEVLPEEAARVAHPFDGYPIQKFKLNMPETVNGKKSMVAKEFSLTDWVLHNHQADPIHQDPSNRSRRTYHSRSIMDLPKGNSAPNVIIQFSTLIHTANGDFYGALVTDPYIRCQLAFIKDKKSGKITVDKRYMLLDPKQDSRLKTCFMRLMKPLEDMERAADAITAGEEPANIREIGPGDEL